jgi:hypothetical protein
MCPQMERKEKEMEEIEAELEAKANATNAANGTNVSMVGLATSKYVKLSFTSSQRQP